MQAVTTIFFDFLKALKLNDLRYFRPGCAKKNANVPKKTPPKTDGESRRTARILRPVLVHQKLEKNRVKFFKRQKKLKTDRASEKKYA